MHPIQTQKRLIGPIKAQNDPHKAKKSKKEDNKKSYKIKFISQYDHIPKNYSDTIATLKNSLRAKKGSENQTLGLQTILQNESYQSI